MFFALFPLCEISPLSRHLTRSFSILFGKGKKMPLALQVKKARKNLNANCCSAPLSLKERSCASFPPVSVYKRGRSNPYFPFHRKEKEQAGCASFPLWFAKGGTTGGNTVTGCFVLKNPLVLSPLLSVLCKTQRGKKGFFLRNKQGEELHFSPCIPFPPGNPCGEEKKAQPLLSSPKE